MTTDKEKDERALRRHDHAARRQQIHLCAPQQVDRAHRVPAHLHDNRRVAGARTAPTVVPHKHLPDRFPPSAAPIIRPHLSRPPPLLERRKASGRSQLPPRCIQDERRRCPVGREIGLRDSGAHGHLTRPHRKRTSRVSRRRNDRVPIRQTLSGYLRSMRFAEARGARWKNLPGPRSPWGRPRIPDPLMPPRVHPSLPSHPPLSSPPLMEKYPVSAPATEDAQASLADEIPPEIQATIPSPFAKVDGDPCCYAACRSVRCAWRALLQPRPHLTRPACNAAASEGLLEALR